jgi:deazaflavin-dependent oxidoreductase (nitroreductase family)
MKENLSQRLARSREIRIGVTGRKSGKLITLPVWFVLQGETLYLLPVQGSDTQWFKNVQKSPNIRVSARDQETDLHANIVLSAAKVSSVVEMFREKYGAGDVKRYYSKFDVAVALRLTS